MQNYQPAKLLRLHFTEHDPHQGEPLYEAIVQKCQEKMLEVGEEKEVEDTYFGQLAVQAKRRAALHSVPLECSIIPGHDVKVIIDFAAEGGFDLLVAGFMGHSAGTNTCGAEGRTI